MNKALMRELNNFFLSEEYGKMKGYGHPALEPLIRNLFNDCKINEEELIKIDEVHCKDIFTLERQGFFRGYEYALIMLNMKTS